MATTLTYERLNALLSYDMTTGLFYWRVRRGKMTAGSLAGGYNALGYLEIRIDRILYLGHRLAWFFVTGEWPPFDIDHENLNTSDNRFWNLRGATRSQNQANQSVDISNTSGRKGVSWNKQKLRWECRVQVDGRPHFLGYFHKLEDAGRAYEIASNRYFGEFARAA